jgi:hypothetical protein
MASREQPKGYAVANDLSAVRQAELFRKADSVRVYACVFDL